MDNSRVRDPGMWALTAYRLRSGSLSLSPVPLRRVVSAASGILAFVSGLVAGMSISDDVKIGARFHLIHPMNVAIASGVEIGDRVGIMHEVTIGRDHALPGVPKIGNDVFIGVGATLLGPIIIGDGAIIAANSLVISDVPPGTFAIGVPAKIVRWGTRPGGTQSRPSAG